MRLFFRDVAELSDKKSFDDALEIVGDGRRRKVLRYKNENAARLSLAAGLAFVDGINSLGIGNGDAAVTEADVGDDTEELPKTYVINNADGGNPVYYNISHSGELAVCGFSEKRIGVDLECIDDRDNRPVIKRFFKSEQDYILEDENGIAERFFRVWTMKECFLKCIGVGLSGLDELPELIPAKALVIEHRGERYSFRQELYKGKYVISICEKEI